MVRSDHRAVNLVPASSCHAYPLCLNIHYELLFTNSQVTGSLGLASACGRHVRSAERVFAKPLSCAPDFFSMWRLR